MSMKKALDTHNSPTVPEFIRSSLEEPSILTVARREFDQAQRPKKELLLAVLPIIITLATENNASYSRNLRRCRD